MLPLEERGEFKEILHILSLHVTVELPDVFTPPAVKWAQAH